LAKELNIPIIALSQLNRSVEGRQGKDGKRPQLADLRESGAIEQDADMVCFIHRPEKYGIMEDDDHNSTAGLAEIIIAKHRNGAVGTVKLRFRAEFAKFLNPEEDLPMQTLQPGGAHEHVMGESSFTSNINQLGGSPLGPDNSGVPF